jgi:SAM-dependent methyltransferase
MLKYTNKELNALKKWGHLRNPFKAYSDYSDLKQELRWQNSEHKKLYKKYWKRRFKWTNGINFKKYYATAYKPIDKKTWEYLRIRKAYYITPLGWDTIAKKGGRLIDFGCGDGDVIQNLIDYVTEYRKKNPKYNNTLEILGVDINKSRIINAKKLVKSNSASIKVSFEVQDITKEIFFKKSKKFDYCFIVGVIEIIDDIDLIKFFKNIQKIIKKGIYIEDLYEKFPGGWPRFNIGMFLEKINFKVAKRKVIFTEPFNIKKLTDPLKIWPIILDQNIWAIRK